MRRLFRKLLRKFMYRDPKRKNDLRLLFDLALVEQDFNRIVPFVNLDGDPHSGVYVGHNKTKVFVRLSSGNLLWVRWYDITMPNDVLKAELSKVSINPEPASKLEDFRHAWSFERAVGKRVTFKQIGRSQEYESVRFKMDFSKYMDKKNPPVHLPMQIIRGWIDRVLFVNELEIVSVTEH